MDKSNVSDLLGLTERRAKEIITYNNLIYFIARKDEVVFTNDWKVMPNRVNLEIRNGLIFKAWLG